MMTMGSTRPFYKGTALDPLGVAPLSWPPLHAARRICASPEFVRVEAPEEQVARSRPEGEGLPHLMRDPEHLRFGVHMHDLEISHG